MVGLIRATTTVTHIKFWQFKGQPAEDTAPNTTNAYLLHTVINLNGLGTPIKHLTPRPSEVPAWYVVSFYGYYWDNVPLGNVPISGHSNIVVFDPRPPVDGPTLPPSGPIITDPRPPGGGIQTLGGGGNGNGSSSGETAHTGTGQTLRGAGAGQGQNVSVPNVNNVSITVNQLDELATIRLTGNAVNNIISNNDDGVVSFDLSGLNDVTVVRIDHSDLNDFAARGLSIVVDEANNLSEAQQDAMLEGEQLFRVSVHTGGLGQNNPRQIRDFRNGTLTVTLPHNGPFPAAVWHMDENGVRTVMDSTYDEHTQSVTFTTSRLSIFIIGQSIAATSPPLIKPPVTFFEGMDHITSDGERLLAPVFRFVTNSADPNYVSSYVMARVVADILNLGWNWNAETRTATFSDETTAVSFTNESSYAQVNGIARPITASGLPADARIIEGRFFVPIAFFSEIFPVDVQWNNADRTVTVIPQ